MTRIVQISDMHLAPLPKPIGRLSLKQFLGYISWMRKRQFSHDPEVLDILKEEIKSCNPDHICITGDQTNLGTRQEYMNSARWIHELAPAEKISVIPGNHDAYGPDYEKNMIMFWSSWMMDQNRCCVGTPYIRYVDDVAVIGVSSAIPTPAFMAYGEVGSDEIDRLHMLAEDLNTKEYFRLLCIHHPPAYNVTSWRRGLLNKEQFHKALEHLSPDLVLHGHMHKEINSEICLKNKSIPVIGVCSASSNGKHIPAAQYLVMEIEKTGAGWTYMAESRRYDAGQKTFLPD